MEELMCFSAFLYQYNESLVFLDVVRRGSGYSPLAALNPPLVLGELAPTKSKSANSHLVFHNRNVSC